MSGLLEVISNGLGSQSMGLLVLAAHGDIPASVSITADTGAEKDRVWNTGERTTAQEYFERIVLPYCNRHGIDARFIRALYKTGKELPDLMQHVKDAIAEGREPNLPLFGSRGGRLRQVCTDKWKIRAIRQEARRLGATQLITAQGIHFGEADRRVKGRFIGESPNYGCVYQDTIKRKKKEIDIKWCQHYYPHVDAKRNRQAVIDDLLIPEGLPWLMSSECDHCPHQDLARWDRHTPEVLTQIAGIEASMRGRFFFTDERIPLMEALELKRRKAQSKVDADFGCENSYCGI